LNKIVIGPQVQTSVSEIVASYAWTVFEQYHYELRFIFSSSKKLVHRLMSVVSKQLSNR